VQKEEKFIYLENTQSYLNKNVAQQWL